MENATTCSRPNCDRPVAVKTYRLCNTHNIRRKRGLPMDDPIKVFEKRGPECSVEDCDRKVYGHGLCNPHYKRWSRHGDPLGGGATLYKTTEESFAARTSWNGDCLEWTGARNANGYGIIYFGGRTRLAHRYAWIDAFGEIPEGMPIDHTCGNPACCNVKHLRVVTVKQNMENRIKVPVNNTSGYRGVYWIARSGKWLAKTKHNGRQYHGGLYDTAEDANEAVIELRSRLHTHNDRDRAA